MREPRVHTYQDLVEVIEARIRCGQYELGSKLPTQDELVEEFELGKTTISKAIAILRDRSLVVSRPPKGTYVVDELPD